MKTKWILNIIIEVTYKYPNSKDIKFYKHLYKTFRVIEKKSIKAALCGALNLNLVTLKKMKKYMTFLVCYPETTSHCRYLSYKNFRGPTSIINWSYIFWILVIYNALAASFYRISDHLPHFLTFEELFCNHQ